MPNKTFYPTAELQMFIRLTPFPGFDADRLIKLVFSPLRFNVERNNFREADTAEILVDFEDFPLDARMIRGATVELFAADAGGLVENFWELQEHANAIENMCIFTGVVDRPETILDKDWRKLKLKCRDYTAYFIDSNLLSIPGWVKDGEKQPFYQVIQDIVLEDIRTKQIEVVIDPEVLELVANDPDKKSLAYPANYKVGAASEKRDKRLIKQGESTWDTIQEISLEAGFITYVYLDKIFIRRPSTIFSKFLSLQDPYHMTLGDDVDFLSIGRDLGRRHGLNVRVISEDADEGITRTASAPEDRLLAMKGNVAVGKILEDRAKKATNATRSNANATIEIQEVPILIRGVFSQPHLQGIANEIWEMLRHHELEGEVRTFNLEDSRGKNLLKLQYGDALEIDIAESFGSIISLDPAEQFRKLLENGYDAEDASEIAQSLNFMNVPYYVNRVRYTFDTQSESGFAIEIDWITRKEVDVDKITEDIEIDQLIDEFEAEGLA